MSRQQARLRWLGGTLAGLAMVISLPLAYEVLWRAGPELVVGVADGEELLRLSLKTDPTWELVWTDPASGASVRDVYLFGEGGIRLSDRLAPSPGLDHPDHPIEGGLVQDDGDGGTWISGLDMHVPGDVHEFSSGDTEAPTRLVHAGRDFDLVATQGPRRLRLWVEAP